MTLGIELDLPGPGTSFARWSVTSQAASGLVQLGSGPGAADHERVMRVFARAIQQLTDYKPGPDMGTSETSMAYVHDEIGRGRRPAPL